MITGHGHMTTPSLASLPIRAPCHLGLDEDSSKELERCLGDKCVQNLRNTCTDSIRDTGGLIIKTWRRDENGDPTGPGEYGNSAGWMLSFTQYQDQTTFIANGDGVWHDLSTKFENNFMFAKQDQAVSIMDYDTFADGSMTLYIPALGLNGKYQLSYGTERTYISDLSMTHPDGDGSERWLYFDVDVHYDIEDTNVKVLLKFVVHIKNTQYTDPSALVSTAKSDEGWRRGFGMRSIFDEYYDNYDEEFGEEDENDLTEEDKERRRREHIENLASMVNKEDAEVEKVSGLWSLRSVTLSQ